jgi:dienelactone hydrolase
MTATQPGCLERSRSPRQEVAVIGLAHGIAAVIGFCEGGGYALMLAPGHGFSVASVNYGGLTRETESFLPQACPIVASYGDRDRYPLQHSQRVQLADRLDDPHHHQIAEHPIPAGARPNPSTS